MILFCFRKECMKPILELETSNGAVLGDDDVISILFSCGQAQVEELQARVLKWNLPSLLERYEEACQNATCRNYNLMQSFIMHKANLF